MADQAKLKIIPDRTYTVPEIAYVIEKKEQTVRIWLREGIIKGIKTNNVWLVTGQEFINFLEKKFGEYARD